MKKNVVKILGFFLLSILTFTGCGSTSNTKSAPSSTTVAVEMQENQITLHANGVDFTLPLPFTKNLDSSYLVELSNLDLSVSGCNISDITFSPTSLVFDGGLNTQQLLTISGSFAPSCIPTGYTFTAKQTISQYGKVKQDDIVFTYDYSAELGEAGYSIINASTPLIIGEENTDYTISMQIIKDGFVSAGKTVKLKPFNDQYGTIQTSTTYTVLSDANGIAKFDYLSPEQLPTDGTTATLEAVVVDENNTIIAGPQSIVLNFNANDDGIETAGYELLAAPDTINIASAGESKPINLYLNNNTTNQPVANQEIIAYTFNPNNGTLSAYSAVTDTNGHVVFNYTAPQTLPGSDLTITFEVANGISFNNKRL